MDDLELCNHKWVGCKCLLCGKTRWLIPIDKYNFSAMSKSELEEVAILMIEKLEDREFETTNYNELVNKLVDYLCPSDEKLLQYAKRKVIDYFSEESNEYNVWINRFVEYWKNLEKEPPIIDYVYDDEQIVSKRKGFISNEKNFYFKVPDQWKQATNNR